ncbi:uncharacterized protein THITE_2119846 [Thermothielavioides terrestris NRRL 8126]|uniref:Uncharacterized protein n=1 Tax=Thermothielavioides terrestris (strain ATCC 38088 / NRRL 8126) TaxID=578455 RepID=G2R8Y7_THETT|nr:uncharacterized protein THITE_2119846 [Thermothielavioides terrestris NRRL 8126]AEO69437.1 hypothetical protein THITE_2119846 [Thermothielavioides terrestris NRRL 8126]
MPSLRPGLSLYNGIGLTPSRFHPVLLGAINVGSGNRPPWTLPAKAAYGAFDARRSVARHANLKIQVPKDLMQAAKTVIVRHLSP